MYVILLTFLLGTAQVSTQRLSCPDWPCVERVLSHVGESRRINRVRVFKGDPALTFSGAALFPPVLDLWRS